jgi:hypothetical protein
MTVVTYKVVPKQTWRGRQPRRWFELCECGLHGNVRRVIARTPAIVGEGEKENERVEQSRQEAKRMLVAFTSAGGWET